MQKCEQIFLTAKNKTPKQQTSCQGLLLFTSLKPYLAGSGLADVPLAFNRSDCTRRSCHSYWYVQSASLALGYLLAQMLYKYKGGVDSDWCFRMESLSGNCLAKIQLKSSKEPLKVQQLSSIIRSAFKK